MTRSRKSLRDNDGQVGTAIGTGLRPVAHLAPKGANGGTGGTASVESEADRYTIAMTQAATTWITAHPAAYRRMVDGTMGQYRGQRGEFAMRMAALMRACADAAGFPCFHVWLERAA